MVCPSLKLLTRLERRYYANSSYVTSHSQTPGIMSAHKVTKTFYSSPSFDFRFSFFFRFLSAFSSGVSPSWRFRFLLSPFSCASTAPPIAGAGELASAGVSAMGSSLGSLGGFSTDFEAVPFCRGALKSLYSSCHLAGVASFGLPYFWTFVNRLIDTSS